MNGIKKIDHPLRGTCVFGCPVYGLCHCGCGMPTNTARQCDRTRDMIGGRPHVYRAGHNRRPRYPRQPRPRIPFQRVLPLVEFLFDTYRTNVAVAQQLGVSETIVRKWKARRVRSVRMTCARALVDAVKREEERLRLEADRERLDAEAERRRRERVRRREAAVA